jgi:diguanylate cyclase (GGDEF)-like protein/PAS domain S-box-containing protein
MQLGFGADSSVAEQLELFQRIFESVGNGISIADARLPELPITYVNPAFERMTGYPAAEACGRNCRYLQGTDRDQPGLTAVRRAIQEGREVRVVLRNYRKDGTMFWNELYMSPIRDRAGVLTHFVGIQNDVTVEMESTQNLEHLAHHDALTGLANRAYLMVQMRLAILRAQRSGQHLAVLFFDLDNFKQVNDVFGHDAGDTLLQVIAKRLRLFARAAETVARLGGDEFVVVLEDFSPNPGAENQQGQPTEAAQRLIAALSEKTEIAGAEISPSASVGMAVFPADGETPEALLKAADLRMYAAKHEARARQEREDEELADYTEPVQRRNG